MCCDAIKTVWSSEKQKHYQFDTQKKWCVSKSQWWVCLCAAGRQ